MYFCFNWSVFFCWFMWNFCVSSSPELFRSLVYWQIEGHTFKRFLCFKSIIFLIYHVKRWSSVAFCLLKLIHPFWFHLWCNDFPYVIADFLRYIKITLWTILAFVKNKSLLCASQILLVLVLQVVFSIRYCMWVLDTIVPHTLHEVILSCKLEGKMKSVLCPFGLFGGQSLFLYAATIKTIILMWFETI